MTTAHRIGFTPNQFEALESALDTAIADYEDDARNGFAYLDDSPKYIEMEDYPNQDERNMALLFQAQVKLYYHIFKRDWGGQWGYYTENGKWGGSAMTSGRWAQSKCLCHSQFDGLDDTCDGDCCEFGGNCPIAHPEKGIRI